MPRLALAAMFSILVLGCAHRPEPPPVDPAGFAREHRLWHQQRVEKLKRENGWLTLAGLFWLKPGENRMGSDPGNDLVFPREAPPLVGTVTLEGEKARFQAAPGVAVTCQGRPVENIDLKSDADPKVEPDRLVVGRFSFVVIQRGQKLAVRLFDNQSPKRLEFSGIPSFPPDPAWRLMGRFRPYEKPRELPFTTVIQTTTQVEIPGELRFEYQGQEYTLLPIGEPGSPELFVVFGDKTNGHQTYGGGRFLYATPSEDNRVVLDFNRAVNPPCAFTHFATCPIPRPENRLPFRVEAGEKKVGDH